MGCSVLIDINELVKQIEKAAPNGVVPLNSSAKIPKTHIDLVASDVGAIATETDPTVASFTKALTSNDAILTALNAASGTISASRLPSYVDDVLSYAALINFPGTGETGKIYVAEDTNKTYRWTGSAYVEISSAATADTALKLTTPRTITTTGDATYSVSFDGSANVSAELTLANTGVTAGTYNALAMQNRPFTIDAKGRVTAVGTPVDITPLWSAITGKPTTLDGYAISGGTLTASLLLPDGTSALPSLSFSGDSDTGISRTGANVIGFSTGGFTRASITTTKFNLFTSLKLDCANTTEATELSANTGAFYCAGGGVFMKNLYAGGLNIPGSITASSQIVLGGSTTTMNSKSSGIRINHETNGSYRSYIYSQGSNILVFDAVGDSELASGAARAGMFLFRTNRGANGGTPLNTYDLMYLIDDKVGINNTSPVYTLDVTGDCKVTSSFIVGANQVLGARKTGYVSSTGTLSRAAFNTETVTLLEVARQLHALRTDLISHGLIGA